jgi:hypothetical protein
MVPLLLNILFTPLESPSIYAGDAINRKYQILVEGEVKALCFLTGFTGDCRFTGNTSLA